MTGRAGTTAGELLPPGETVRLAALASFEILDTEPEQVFDDLVRLAARIAGVPTSLVSLLDAERQWFKARVGMDVCSTGRDVAFCEHVLQAQAELEVVDARLDPRFADNPLVTDAPYIVSYAGFPLVVNGGHVLGTLCVIGYEPHELDEEQREGLRVLARQVVTQLELRRRTAEQAREVDHLRQVECELARSKREYQLLAEHSTDIISRHGLDGIVTYVSPAVRDVLGYEPGSEASLDAKSHVHPDDVSTLESALTSVVGGSNAAATVRSRHADGTWRWMEIRLAPLLDEQGLVEVYSAARDVTEQVEASVALAARNEFVRAVLDSVAVGVVACDGDGKLTVFNHSSRDFHGIAPDSTVPPELWAERFDLYRSDGTTPLPASEIPLYRALTAGRVEDVEIVIAPHGLPARLVRCDGQALHDESGTTIGAVVAMSDITASRAAERRLREAHDALSSSRDALARSEAQFRSAFDHGPMAMGRLDGAGVLVQVNAAFRRLLALSSAALEDRKLTSLVLATDRERIALILASAGGSGALPDYVEARVRRPDGSSLWCEIAVTASTDPDGRSYLLVQLADVDDRKRRELDLEMQANRDPLTGLANRSTLHRRLTEILASASVGTRCAVLFLDLNGFKSVNDTAGHAAGDEVLIEVGRRLVALVRPSDLVVRLGGDEFVIVRQDAEGGSQARCAQLVERVHLAFGEPFVTASGMQRVGASVGVVLAAPGDDPAAVLAAADTAMYVDKRRVGSTLPLQRAQPTPLPVVRP